MNGSLLMALTVSGAGLVAGAGAEPGSTEPAAAGVALRAAKILTCAWDGPQVVDHGVLLMRDGRIEAVGAAREVEVPEGYEVVDVGDDWLAPGLVEMHSHEAGVSLYSFVNDLNDMVYLSNPGMRASASVEPGVHAMKMGLAGGVTSLLYIPGSGTNIGGQGITLKSGFDTYEENLIRSPGSLKLAQYGNPESWGPGVRMSFEQWNTRETMRRGIAYAKRWIAYEEGEGPEPQRDIGLDVYRDLVAGDIAISTHTQIYQVVLATITIIHDELGLPVFLDHSTIGGWRTGEMVAERDMAAICGPRSVDSFARGFINWAKNGHEGMRGVAAGYQERGVELVGFNTDAPVIPQEELSLNGAMGARYGFDDSRMQVLRGLTIVPARAAHIDDRVGSLEPGKDADVLVVDGHPADPRTTMKVVFVNGERVYDAARDGRRW